MPLTCGTTCNFHVLRISLGYRAAAGLAMASMVATTGLVAQQPQRAEQVEVARIIVDTRVVDDDGQPILGLEPADFDVRIDGQRVGVESAQWIGGEGPVSAPIQATDLAGVIEPRVRGRLIIFVVQKSLVGVRAIGLLRLLQDSGRLLTWLNPEDRIAVLSFDSHLKIWLDFTDDIDRVRTVLAEEVMFRDPAPVEPGQGVSLVSRLNPQVARATYSIENALRLLGTALESLPGSKSVVLIGHGFGQLTVTLGMFGATLNRDYAEARTALHAARAAVFSLDITDADHHTFDHGLEKVAVETGGFFARTHLHGRRAIDRVANALVGHYVLFTERPNSESGTHRIEVELVRVKGKVFARSSYID